MEKTVSEEKLQVFSLLIDGPFIFSMDKRSIYQNNNYIIFDGDDDNLDSQFCFDLSHGQALNYAAVTVNCNIKMNTTEL